MRMRVGLAAGVVVVFCWVASAAGAVTPGWECVPTAVGGTVVSGGTGASPSCAAGTTVVLAPTFVSSGVGGKPTVEFSTVNVQVVSGSGSTGGTVNGMGNLVIGYAENPKGYVRTGSNDLIVGTGNGWTGFGEIVGGANNRASGAYATTFGLSNIASGMESAILGGHKNSAATNCRTVPTAPNDSC